MSIKKFLFFILTGLFLTVVIPAQVRYTVIPESPRPGEPVTIGLDTFATEAVLFVNGEQKGKAKCFIVPPGYRQRSFTAAIITIPTTIEADNAVIRVNNENGILCEIHIKISPREFRSETLHLTPSLTTLVTDQSDQRAAESNRLWAILTTNGTDIYHTDQFIPPVTSTRRTSHFGSRRINQYSDGRRVTSIHAGVDYGIPTGTEIVACGAGRVVLARNRIISGYSVIIEHAPGVYSIYYHLDKILVEENTNVETRDLIGLSGSTGFSTGPHLHWEIRINTENTDPDFFLERPLIDKNLINSRIY
ncbi:MAG: M23 family metallopeptidase [Treponema sp.]|nr:M23 family metallopeptidase [Treponema sp.]